MIITNNTQFGFGTASVAIAVTSLAVIGCVRGLSKVQKGLLAIGALALGAFGGYTCWSNVYRPVPCDLGNRALTFSNPQARELAGALCECPPAAIEFNRIIGKHPIRIEVGDAPAVRTKPLDKGAVIEIPKTIPLRTEGLGRRSAIESAMFELFNTEPKARRERLMKQCVGGQMSLAKYAEEKGDTEFYANSKTTTIANLCKNVWGIELDYVPNPDCTDFPKNTLATFRFFNELAGHNDYYKRQWIDNCRYFYCVKNPEDRASCDAKIEDFVDYEAVLRYPPKQAAAFKHARFHPLLEKAPTEVQEAVVAIWQKGKLCL